MAEKRDSYKLLLADLLVKNYAKISNCQAELNYLVEITTDIDKRFTALENKEKKMTDTNQLSIIDRARMSAHKAATDLARKDWLYDDANGIWRSYDNLTACAYESCETFIANEPPLSTRSIMEITTEFRDGFIETYDDYNPEMGDHDNNSSRDDNPFLSIDEAAVASQNNNDEMTELQRLASLVQETYHMMNEYVSRNRDKARVYLDTVHEKADSFYAGQGTDSYWAGFHSGRLNAAGIIADLINY